jgi:GMP synthase (glutamine-hydrolysing)
MQPRLKTGIWVQALIRRCDRAAIGVAVVAKGDGDAGAILLKLSGREGDATVLAQARRADGAAVWMRATGAAPVTDAEADSYIARQRGRDPDLWVIEIESLAPDDLLDMPIVS